MKLNYCTQKGVFQYFVNDKLSVKLNKVEDNFGFRVCLDYRVEDEYLIADLVNNSNGFDFEIKKEGVNLSFEVDDLGSLKYNLSRELLGFKGILSDYEIEQSILFFNGADELVDSFFQDHEGYINSFNPDFFTKFINDKIGQEEIFPRKGSLDGERSNFCSLISYVLKEHPDYDVDVFNRNPCLTEDEPFDSNVFEVLLKSGESYLKRSLALVNSFENESSFEKGYDDSKLAYVDSERAYKIFSFLSNVAFTSKKYPFNLLAESMLGKVESTLRRGIFLNHYYLMRGNFSAASRVSQTTFSEIKNCGLLYTPYHNSLQKYVKSEEHFKDMEKDKVFRWISGVNDGYLPAYNFSKEMKDNSLKTLEFEKNKGYSLVSLGLDEMLLEDKIKHCRKHELYEKIFPFEERWSYVVEEEDFLGLKGVYEFSF